MSYSLSIPATPRADVADRLLAEAMRYMAEQVEPSEWQPTDEVRHHLVAAVAAVAPLATSIGRDEDSLLVTISGHANPDHAPTEGYSDECVTVSVSVAKPAVAEAE